MMPGVGPCWFVLVSVFRFVKGAEEGSLVFREERLPLWWFDNLIYL